MSRPQWSFYKAATIGVVLLFSLEHGLAADQPPGTPVKVYRAGNGLTAPALLGADLAGAIQTNCDRTIRGKIKIAAVIDSDGIPRNLMFVQAIGSDLDRLALAIVGLDRFKPALRDRIPVATGEMIALDLTGCVQHLRNESGNTTEHLRLASVPSQTIEAYAHYPDQVIFAQEMPVQHPGHGNGHSISPPVPILYPETEFTPEARAKHIQGECMFSVIVDGNGLPHVVSIVKHLDPGLDQNAFLAVSKYRFKPALKDGMQPVPVLVTVDVNFRQESLQPRLMRPQP